MPVSAKPTKQGIIVLGLPRSGTTLIRRILNAHPSIACGGESFLLRATAQFLRGDTIVDGIDYGVLGGLQSAGFTREEVLSRVRTLAFSFLEDFAAENKKPRWATKSAVDSFYLPQIEALYADHAQFVCLVRHGLDTVLSLDDLCVANEVFIKELHAYVKQYARPLEAYAHAWRDVTDQLLDFVERHADRAILIRYEDLVANPDAKTAELFGFLGESADADLLERALEAEMAQGLGDWKTHGRTSIDASSVGRAADLREDIISRLAPIMNPTLKKGGYDSAPMKPLPGHDEAIRRYELLMRFNAARADADSNDS